MLSVDDAKRIAAVWRPQFPDEADFELSWTRYMESATVPDESRLEVWLAKDLGKSEVKHAGIVHEPLLPTLSRFDLNGCSHCYGRGYVRQDLRPGHPEFGKALLCPACHGRSGDQSDCAAPVERNLCYKCRQFEDEPAAEICANPGWHWPNWTGAAGATVDTVLKRF